MDLLSPTQRSALMSKVRSRNTKPELAVRRVAHRAGLRFRLHRNDLPGSPDLIFPRHRIAVFVHGCFWHRHLGCKRTTTPVSNASKWHEKFERNRARDAKVTADLEALGWDVLVIWECETRDEASVREKIVGRIGRGHIAATSPLDKVTKLLDKDEKRGRPIAI